MANTSDTTYAIIAEVVPGTVPATPAFQRVDYVQGSQPTFTSDFVNSQVVRSNRAAAAGRKTNFRVEGSLQVEFCRDAAVELLLQSALSGTWTTNVLKGAATDTSLTIEERMVEPPSTVLFKRHTGCQVSSFALSVTAEGMSEATFDIIGMGRTMAETIVTGATYTGPGSAQKLTGLDLTSVSVAGLTGLVATGARLTVSHDRSALTQFGTAQARGIATQGLRTVTLELDVYRGDNALETVLTSDTPIAVSFTIGAGANGYTILLPAAVPALPSDDNGGPAVMTTLAFTGSLDSVTGTDVQITRLS